MGRPRAQASRQTSCCSTSDTARRHRPGWRPNCAGQRRPRHASPPLQNRGPGNVCRSAPCRFAACRASRSWPAMPQRLGPGRRSGRRSFPAGPSWFRTSIGNWRRSTSSRLVPILVVLSFGWIRPVRSSFRSTMVDTRWRSPRAKRLSNARRLMIWKRRSIASRIWRGSATSMNRCIGRRWLFEPSSSGSRESGEGSHLPFSCPLSLIE